MLPQVQEHRFIKIRQLDLEEDVSGASKTSTYIEPKVWQGLSSEHYRNIIQAREKKSQEQVAVKKLPYVPRKAVKTQRAKAARARAIAPRRL